MIFDFYGGVKIDLIVEKLIKNVFFYVKYLNIISYGIEDLKGNYFFVL